MSEATLLESRVDKIERDNRRLKLTVGALLLALAAVPLIGAVMPEQIQDVVRARRFEVIDGNGVNLRMGTTGIHYWDKNGTTRALINDLGIAYFADFGDRSAAMDPFGIHYRGENGDVVWSTICGFEPC